MPVPRLRLGSPAWLRWPPRTARLRFTAVNGGLFLLSGAALVTTTYVLFERATEYKKPELPQVPHAPAIQDLQLPRPLAQALPRLARDQLKLTQAQYRLAHALGTDPPASGHAYPVPQLAQDHRQLAQDQHLLAQDQHQLVAVQHQLAAAVHQIARAGSVEAAQRAADSHQLLVDSGIALAIVAVLAGWLAAGRILRPIRTITRTARRISSASLHERLALDGPQDELKELGDTLDDLFDRLESSFEAQRQFAANASRELRTPLARQRALIQVALADPRASFSSLRAAHERVRGRAGPERREHLDLATLASQALLAREVEAAQRDLDVRATLATAPLMGDPRLIERLVANLIDNAIRHNIPHGQIEITTGTHDRHALVSIANTGPAIPPQAIQRLFQPFQRLGANRTRHNGGHGLGLSIVKAIAAAHRATLTTHARPQGGLVVEVSFPAVLEDAPADARPAPLLAVEAER